MDIPALFRRRKGPPTPQEVARRAIVLRHVVIYALTSPPRDMLKEMTTSWSAGDNASFRSEGLKRRDEYWSRLGPYKTYLSKSERAFAGTTMVTMTGEQQVNASWRIESLQVLLGALGSVQGMPPYDTSADHDLLKSFRPDDPRSFVAEASLLPLATLQKARDVAELWHWRSRTRQLVESGEALPENLGGGIRTFDDIVRLTAQHALENGSLGDLIDGDFPASGKAYRSLTAEEWSTIGSITRERHFALNWLCGRAPGNDWDRTPTDT